MVFELGAGTGEIGRHLAVLGNRYVGVDLSWPMLAVFRSKLASDRRRSQSSMLVQAHADRTWPVTDGSVAIVFASRVAHLLEPGHVVAESRRVCRAGGCFVVGRVERTGMKKVLRQQREAILVRRGLARARSGGQRTKKLVETFLAGGATPIPTRAVASWTVTTTAGQVIAAWEGMPTMAGRAVDPALGAEVLGELRGWARERFGSLDNPSAVSETYTLDGVRLL